MENSLEEALFNTPIIFRKFCINRVSNNELFLKSEGFFLIFVIYALFYNPSVLQIL